MQKNGKFVVGIDPGNNNFAVTYFYVNKEGNVSIKKSYLLPKEDIISNLTFEAKKGKKRGKRVIKYIGAKASYKELVERYSNQMDSLLTNEIDLVGIERWMVRGRFGGAQSETVSIMIGILTEKCRKKNITIKLLNAAVWKNAINKTNKEFLKTIYKWCDKKYKLPPHYVDSFFQGCYASGVDFKKVATKKMMSLLAFVAGYNKGKK